MFVQIHFESDYSAALQNRDQSGHAKRAPYGNATRQRISSQCFKAALRRSGGRIEVDPATGEVRYIGGFVRFDPAAGGLVSDRMSDLAASLGTDMAFRSRLVFPRRMLPALRTRLDGTGIDVEPYVAVAASLFRKSEKDTAGNGPAPEAEVDGEDPDALEAGDAAGAGAEEEAAADGEAVAPSGNSLALKQPVVLGEREIEAIVNTLEALAREGVSADDVADHLAAAGLIAPRKKKSEEAGKGGKEAKANGRGKRANLAKLSGAAKSAVDNLKAVRAQAGLDGLLFGRFSTTDLFGTVDSCVNVAHLLTTHRVMAVPDYFSVLDMAQQEDEHGAAHTNSSEIASGLFYGYIVVDLAQLVANIPAAGPEEIGRIVAWLVRAIYQVEPAAKRGSTAPFHTTQEMLVEIGRRQPRSLMAAFQQAVRPSEARSLTEESTVRLRAEVARSNARGGKPAHQLWLSEILAKMEKEEAAKTEEAADSAKVGKADGSLEEMAAYERLADEVRQIVVQETRAVMTDADQRPIPRPVPERPASLPSQAAPVRADQAPGPRPQAAASGTTEHRVVAKAATPTRAPSGRAASGRGSAGKAAAKPAPAKRSPGRPRRT